ncbi:MAG: chemotaxis protein CheA [Thermoanaerobaculales bacterium]|nr:chemotaxis protein CheA [Thermoanaerobaculales bacterium]
MADTNLLDVFIIETEGNVLALEQGLLALEEKPNDEEQVNMIFRAAHTIKGSAAIVEMPELEKFTHLLEHVLDRVRQHGLEITHQLISSLLSSVDTIKEMLVKMGAGISIDAIDPTQFENLKRWSGPQHEAQDVCSVLPEERTYSIELALRKDIFSTGLDPEMIIAELAELGTLTAIEPNLDDLPPFEDLDVHTLYLRWHIELRTRRPRSDLDNVFVFVIEENPIRIVELGHADDPLPNGFKTVSDDRSPSDLGELNTQHGPSSVIRLDVSKLDDIVNLVGEFVIEASQAGQMLRTGTESLRTRVEAADSLAKRTREFREKVMALRMLPVEVTFSRLHRVVRDLAGDLGKKIRLKTSGTETEIDKNVSDQLIDPLIHLVRNAAHHGIEDPETRLRNGKTEQGTIEVKAAQREGSVLIEVRDDGRGLDGGKIRQKALELGLLAEEEIPSDKDLFDLIFRPGFSTATQIDRVSGRGVGLDVVRTNLQALGGDVEAGAEAGKGTCFRLRMPLTLAIIDVMKIEVRHEILMVPLLSIVKQMKAQSTAIHTIEPGCEAIRFSGEFLPLVRPAELFALEGEASDQGDGMVLILESDGRRLALLVDDILGQDQVVMKSLDTNYRRVRGISGASIMGNGHVAMILDVHGMEKLAFPDTRERLTS